MTDIKSCPFCESDLIGMHINRLGVSYIRCDSCGAKIEIDGTQCSDAPTGMLIDALISKWNRRVNE